jgi:hypothetical protein
MLSPGTDAQGEANADTHPRRKHATPQPSPRLAATQSGALPSTTAEEIVPAGPVPRTRPCMPTSGRTCPATA